MSPFGNIPTSVLNAFIQAAEDMGTMDFTPYLLMRGWEFRSHAGQPGLDYLADPQTGETILNLVGVNWQMARDGNGDINSSDPIIQAFMQHARRAAPLPEPLRTQVREYRERQKAAGLQNHQPVPDQPEQPTVAPPSDLGDYYTPPEPADPLTDIVGAVLEAQPATNPILVMNPDVLTPVTVGDVQKRRKKTKPEPKPEVQPKSPFGRNFTFGDRE